MRHPGQVRLALKTAASELVSRPAPGLIQGGTLKELAGRAGVGAEAALSTIKNMTRVGELVCISGRRKVPYRNKRVAEYFPPAIAAEVKTAEPGAENPVDFDELLTAWK